VAGASNQVTRGNKLSMLTQMGSLLVMLATIMLAWGDVKTRIAMAEQRITQLEGQTAATATRRESDNAALLQLAGEVKVSNAEIKNLTEALKGVQASVSDLQRGPPRR
jgi:uncharacterized coiled-coil protein SlyX